MSINCKRLIRIKLIVSFLFITAVLNAQEKYGIELPNTKENLNRCPQIAAKILNIYVTENHEVYINDELLTYWDEVITKVMQINRNWGVEQVFLSSIKFYCDRNSEYQFLDKLKEEVARSGKKFFLYKTSKFTDTSCLAEVVHGTVKKQWPRHIIRPKGKERDTIILVENYTPDWIANQEFSLNDELRFNFRKYLYSGNKEKVENILSLSKSASITLLPGKKYNFRGGIYEVTDLKQITKFVASGGILFCRFDAELTYQDYIYFLERRYEIFKNKKNNPENYGILVEVSFGLEKKLKDWQLDIFEVNFNKFRTGN